MGLSSALNNAIYGLKYTQSQVAVASNNIANAGTDGYSTKSISGKVYVNSEGMTSGLVKTTVQRTLNETLQGHFRESNSDANYWDTLQNITSRLDEIFGTIEDDASLTNLIGDISASLTELVNDPSGYSSQLEVVGAAKSLALQLNSMASSVEQLRLDADRSIAGQVDQVNGLLENVAELDGQIREASVAGRSVADLMDQRDRMVDQLSGYMDINIADRENNGIRLTTSAGQVLYDKEPSTLAFDTSNAFGSGQTGNAISLIAPGGLETDLSGTNSLRSGSLAAHINLRDDILVEAQSQLDEIASQLSLAFSNVDVAGTPATVGVNNGFDIDLSSLQSGNQLTFDYIDETTGEPQTVTFVAVNDPSVLPLDNSATNNPNDTVYGIDFSAGTASAITDISTALGGGFTVNDLGGGTVQILDDGGATTTASSLVANVTPTASTDQGLGLNIFVDGRSGIDPFTGSLEGGDQSVGYAASISINPDLAADPGQLVNYQTTPEVNSEGDAARPEFLLNALTSTEFTFSPGAGIGSSSAPFEGTIADYVNEVVSHQGEQAEDVNRQQSSSQIIFSSYEVQFEQSYTVNIDTELAFLVELQNAYTANARVLTAVQEMFDDLLNAVR
ncbi:MAG: flagellar hook-associated protein FlgK [Stappiaceae bacterium]